MSDKLIFCLLIAYVVIAGVCVWERNWPRTLYWISAIAWGFVVFIWSGIFRYVFSHIVITIK